MADYKRLVSYIYMYDKGEKTKNMGFAKIESRDGVCKIGINIKGIFIGGQNVCKAYGIVRKDGAMLGVPIGEFKPINGTAELKATTDSENIGNSGYSLDDLGGILVQALGDKVYATEWDDHPIEVARFRVLSEEQIKENNADIAVEAAGLNNEAVEQSQEPGDEQTLSQENAAIPDVHTKLEESGNNEQDLETLEAAAVLDDLQAAEQQAACQMEQQATRCGAYPQAGQSWNGRNMNQSWRSRTWLPSGQPVNDSNCGQNQQMGGSVKRPNDSRQCPKCGMEIQKQPPRECMESINTGNCNQESTMYQKKPDCESQKKSAPGVCDPCRPENLLKPADSPQMEHAPDCGWPKEKNSEEYKPIRSEDQQRPDCGWPRETEPEGGKPCMMDSRAMPDYGNMKCRDQPERCSPKEYPPYQPVPCQSGQDQNNNWKQEECVRGRCHQDHMGNDDPQAPCEAGGTSQKIPCNSEEMVDCRELWQDLQTKYPKIQPFSDNEITECIRIQPKDLSVLPKQEWAIGNNSFLLHGYYNHRYLILGKRVAAGETSVVLGVPGIYYQQEKVMAAMFGFTEFKTVKPINLKQGTFGYWCKKLHMEV